MNENRNLKKGVGIHARRFIAYVVLATDRIYRTDHCFHIVSVLVLCTVYQCNQIKR